MCVRETAMQWTVEKSGSLQTCMQTYFVHQIHYKRRNMVELRRYDSQGDTKQTYKVEDKEEKC